MDMMNALLFQQVKKQNKGQYFSPATKIADLQETI